MLESKGWHFPSYLSQKMGIFFTRSVFFATHATAVHRCA